MCWALICTATSSATKELAKDISQATITKIKVDILPLAKVAKTSEWVTATTTAGSTPNARMAKLVIPLALLLILQDLIRFINFFEFLFTPTRFIWVVLHCQFAECPLDVIIAGAFGNTKHLIIISLRHICLSIANWHSNCKSANRSFLMFR